MPQHAITQEEYERTWRKVQSAVFSGAEPVADLFRDSNWRVIPLAAGMELDPDTFGALAACATALGDEDYLITGHREEFSAQPIFLVSWNRTTVKEIVAGTILGHIDSVSLGQSGKWGLLGSPEGFAILGGTPDFMNCFLDHAGGEKVLEDRFRSAALRGEMGFGEQGRQFLDELLSVVGWRPLSRSG